MTAPCTQCAKQITLGYGSTLSGIWICKSCLNKNQEMQSRLTLEAKKKFDAENKTKKSEVEQDIEAFTEALKTQKMENKNNV